MYVCVNYLNNYFFSCFINYTYAFTISNPFFCLSAQRLLFDFDFKYFVEVFLIKYLEFYPTIFFPAKLKVIGAFHEGVCESAYILYLYTRKPMLNHFDLSAHSPLFRARDLEELLNQVSCVRKILLNLDG